ncbi:uncharacterized protein V1516DRAFT_670476 [Lipomyces oligophaga]|uniref:uncharacterized protein n=1 Tax=Lipomyces oligophaga TaxID=45792 RepID=UPI0034CDD16E
MVSAVQDDLEAIRQDYISSLQELTFNSRPIISTLTIIAQENIQAAEVISRAIEDHIARCGQSSKLPALYLLDSICKNVGSPYTRYFGRNLYHTFTNAYTQVTDAVRVKMHELFQTWTEPVPSTGQRLFDNEPIRKIEGYLSKAQKALKGAQIVAKPNGPGFRATPPLNSVSRFPPAPLQPGPTGAGSYSSFQAGNQQASVTTESLLVQIDDLRAAMTRKLREMPSDLESQNQLEMLGKLYNVVLTSSLSLADMKATKDKLDSFAADIKQQTMKRKTPPLSNDLPVAPSAKRSWNSPRMELQTTWTPPSDPATLPVDPVVSQALFGSIPASVSNNAAVPPSAIQDNLIAQLLGQQLPQQLPQLPPQPQQPQFDINTILGLALPGFAPPHQQQQQPLPQQPIPDLLSAAAAALTSSGLPNQAQNSDASAAASLLASLMSAGLLPGSGQPIISSVDARLSRLMGPDVELTNKFLQTSREDLISLLYEEMPLRCSTCGRRFADTELDRKLRDAHLDWHFRVNKRLREDTRGHSRSWYFDEDAWHKLTAAVDGADLNLDDLGENGSGILSNGTSNDLSGDSDKNSVIAEIASRYIPTPTDPTVVNTPCPVCKEKFKSKWHEPAEEWVWMNAVRGDNGKIYHATCVKEANLFPL